MKAQRVEVSTSTKRVAYNMIFNVAAFLLNLGINFFVTPYITKKFGAEAYGFVRLANDFASYASIFSIALNSMASRFIMIELAKGNKESVNKYYSSVMLANIFLAGILVIPSGVCVIFVDKLLEVPQGLVFEVQLTFAITFGNFLLKLVFSTFENCFYMSNRLDIGAVGAMVSNIVKAVGILALFVFFMPRISYIAVGTLIASVVLVLYNIYYTRKLIPGMRFSIKQFEKAKVVQVLSSGVWNSITRLSQIFSSGLDLLITNLFIGSAEMGYLSVAKTIPNILVGFNASVANAFSPNLMILYAKDDMQGLQRTAKQAMKFMCLFVSLPNAVLISMGVEFFELWIPGQPATLINVLSVLTIINSCITGPMQPLYQIFTITNKVRQSSVIMIIYGFVSVLVTFICLKTTEAGIYAVVIVSLVGSIIVALGYHLPYAAKYIGLPWYTFFPEIVKSIISLIVVCGVGFCVNGLLNMNTWTMWFFGAITTAVIGFIIDFCWMLNREEKNRLLCFVKKKLKK